jgi:hypothetical protein
MSKETCVFKRFAIGIVLVALAGCTPGRLARSDYVRLSGETYAPTPNYDAITVLVVPPTQRFEVIGTVETHGSPYAAKSDLIADMRRRAAAAGGHAIMNLTFGRWQSHTGTSTARSTRYGGGRSGPHGQYANASSSITTYSAPMTYGGYTAAATVIRYVENVPAILMQPVPSAAPRP